MGHGRNLALTKYPNNMRILKSVVAGENFGYPDKVPQQSTPGYLANTLYSRAIGSKKWPTTSARPDGR